MSRRALPVALLVACLFVLGAVARPCADPAHAPVLPDPTLTPGDVLTTDTTVICTPGYTKTVRHVPQSVQNQVYRQYGVTQRAPHEYEIDHLISLELGGSNSVRNLWPQSYRTTPLNASVKDRLENRLHALVCGGTLSLPQAQQAIATNWPAAYVQYIGPLPGSATPEHPTGTAAPVSSSALPAGMENGRTANADGSCPAAVPIKGTQSGIYHLPGDPYYTRSKAVHCFSTAEEAHTAGFRAPKR